MLLTKCLGKDRKYLLTIACFVSNALFIFCVPLHYIYTNTQKKWIIQSSLSG